LGKELPFALEARVVRVEGQLQGHGAWRFIEAHGKVDGSVGALA
jgi:hypothetical protein